MKFSIFILSLVVSCNVFGQGTPYLPSAHPSGIPISYVRSWSATAPEQNGATLITRPLKDVQLSTAYFDGLGRPLQTVVKQGSLITDPNSPASSANAVDMVNAVVYDALGREQYKFLPFAANNTGSNTSISDGGFKLNPFQQQATFAAAQYPGETYYYSKTNFEASPLNRVADAYGPGDSWVGSEGNSNAATRRNVATQYLFNEANDSVRIWTVSGNTFSTSSTYTAGQLGEAVTIDEHKNKVVEYKDKSGKVILKKVQLSSSPSEGHYGWLCTYYIYDYAGLLRCVLQPAAVEAINGTWSLTTTILDELCFRYSYDQRNRMTVKKVPGAGEVFMVYDAKDRLVLTQDSNLRAQNKWLYTTYDALNRPVATGLWTSSQSHSYQLSNAYSASTYPSTSEISTNGQELTHNFYDDYSWVLDILGSGYNYSTTDNGEFATASNSTWPYPQSLTQSTAVKGMLTGSRVRVLGTSQFLYTVSYYDADGRVIQIQAENVSGDKDVITTQYDFSGKVLQTVVRHVKGGTNSQTHIIQTRNSYDEAGRLIKIEKKLNSTIGSTTLAEGWHTMTSLEYDALGQLKKKKLAPGYGTGGLDTLTNAYNIRGWLTSINKGYVAGTADAWFGMELGYDKDGYATLNNKQFNGNMSATIWRTRGDGEKRKYDFGYDAVNRLLKADFTQAAGGSWNVNAGIDFSMKMGDGSDATTAYDANGNIKKMWQRGWKFGGSVTIDSLIYKGNDYSNKLKYVRDGANVPDSRLFDFKEPASNNSDNLNSNTADYSYDGNGNLTVDNNKDISGIIYNHLNFSDSIIVTGKGSIKYVYDAAGNKLKKIVHESGKLDQATVYIDDFEYENDTLQFLQHEEGRIRLIVNSANTYTGYAFDYFEKDHLGNVRVLLTEQQDTSAYPEASMETGNLGRDSLYYSKISDTRVQTSSVSGYPSNDSYTNPNDWVAKVSGSGNKVGPGIVLKVMTGDKFNVRVSSWYKANGATPGTPASPLSDLLAALISGVSGAGKFEATALQSGTVLSDNVTSFLNSQTVISGRPKAYLNWILFDEQLNYVSTSSGFEQVPAESVYGNGGGSPSVYVHQQSNIPISKSGYLYIYVSNETPNIDVFFDNLQVTHLRGSLQEETHYYPFGLTMDGISTKALGRAENRRKYNGIELLSDFDLSIYDAELRELDPQVGRWWQVDPKADGMELWSPYASNYDNPVKFADPLGDEPESEDDCCGLGALFNPIKFHEVVDPYAKKVNEGIRKGVIAAGGVLNGALHSLTLGAWPTNPVGQINYTDEDVDLDNSASQLGGFSTLPLGTIAPTMGPMPKAATSPEVTIPLNGLLETKTFVPTPPNLITTNSSSSNSSSTNVNGNSKNSGKPQHGYEIRNKQTNDVHKYGVSGGKLNKDGSSKRANTQVSTLNKPSNSQNYQARVVKKNVATRQQILDWEKGKVKGYKVRTGKQPNGNTRPKVD